MATRQEMIKEIIVQMHRFTTCDLQMLNKHAEKLAPSKALKKMIADAPIEVKQAFFEVALSFFGLHLSSIFNINKPEILSRGDMSKQTVSSLPSIDEMHALRDAYLAELIANTPIQRLQEGLAHMKAFTKADCVRYWHKLDLELTEQRT